MISCLVLPTLTERADRQTSPEPMTLADMSTKESLVVNLTSPIEAAHDRSFDLYFAIGRRLTALNCFVGSTAECFEAEEIVLSDQRNSTGYYLRAAGLPSRALQARPARYRSARP